MSITIYGTIGSRASRCLWTAEEIGIAYEWNPISTLDGSNKKPEYLAINPSGRTPAMTDGKVKMAESLGINLYLAQSYGKGGIWPDDPVLQARALQWTLWSASEIEYYIGALYVNMIMKPADKRDQAFIDGLIGSMMPRLTELDKALEGKEYILCDFSLADINTGVHMFTVVDNFRLNLDHLPNVRDWVERCRARPARQKIIALFAAAAAAKK